MTIYTTYECGCEFIHEECGDCLEPGSCGRHAPDDEHLCEYCMAKVSLAEESLCSSCEAEVRYFDRERAGEL